MNTTILSIILVRGLGIGFVFALVAMAMNIVFRSSGIINFAIGNLFVIGGLAAFLMLSPQTDPLTWMLLLLAATALLALLVLAQGYLTLLPLKSAVEQHSWLVTTMAFSVMIGAMLLISQGPNTHPVTSIFRPMRLAGVNTPMAYAFAAALALAWYAGLRTFLRRTRTGLALDALSQDLTAARAAGLPVRRLQLLAFGISGAILGSAGFAAAPVLAIAPDTGTGYVLNGFIAAVAGGFGNNTGALFGGAMLGLVNVATAYYLGSELQNAVSLMALVLVLMIRPQGLFGRPGARRV